MYNTLFIVHELYNQIYIDKETIELALSFFRLSSITCFIASDILNSTLSDSASGESVMGKIYTIYLTPPMSVLCIYETQIYTFVIGGFSWSTNVCLSELTDRLFTGVSAQVGNLHVSKVTLDSVLSSHKQWYSGLKIILSIARSYIPLWEKVTKIILIFY